jgi:hypothetical protein
MLVIKSQIKHSSLFLHNRKEPSNKVGVKEPKIIKNAKAAKQIACPVAILLP